MGNFERVESKGTQTGEVYLRISPKSDSSYLTVGVIRRWFEGVERVTFYVDRDHSKLAIVAEDGEHSYSLSRKDGGTTGAHLPVKQPLRELGIEQDEMEGSYVCPVEKDRDSGYVVADVSELVEAETDDVHCPECGVRFTQHGVKSHLTTVHGESKKSVGAILQEMDPDDLGGPAPEGDDSWREQYDRGRAVADEAEEASSG